MLGRSVPFYAEIQRMLAEISADFGVPGSVLYDLGCSTGTTLLELDGRLDPDVTFVGIDSSPEMLERAREKLAMAGFPRPFELLCLDLNEALPIRNASVVILNLTLQFIRPDKRAHLIRDIAEGLNNGGCLILVEKVLGQTPEIDSLFVRYHQEFKGRQGYSEVEIARKREALENVLIPFDPLENRDLILNNGFASMDVFFRWYNFCGMIALK